MRAPDRLRGIFIATSFAVLSVALLGASCDKKSVASPTDPGPSAPFEAPGKAAAVPVAAKPPAPAPTPTAPPAAAAADGNRYAKLAAKLQSPCGEAQSLAKTLEAPGNCKRAPFAKAYLEKLIKVGLDDDQINEIYAGRYSKETFQFDLKNTPFLGSPNAPVVIVEFSDYGCPHCRDAVPVIEQIAAKHSADAVIYFKMFPLPMHKDSVPAAKASLAAARQGKFEEMHRKLFSNQGAQSKDDLFGYAKELGLDMAKFEADFNDPAIAAKIDADKTEGERAKLEGTPTLYINGRKSLDPIRVEDFDEIIAEELAVNK